MPRARLILHLVLALLTAGAGSVPRPADAAEPQVVIAETASIVRTPSNGAERVAWLKRGDRVSVVQRNAPGEWLQVSARDGSVTGYLHASMVVPETDARARAEQAFKQAYTAMRSGLYPAAAGHFELGLALHPADGIASFYAGETMLVLGRKDDAAALFRTAVRLAPGTEEAKHAKTRLAQVGTTPAAASPAAAAASVTYVVTAKIANVRAGPSTATDQREWLQRGTRVRGTAAADDPDWLRIERDGRQIGYLHRSLAIPEAEAGAAARALFTKAFDAVQAGRWQEAAAALEDGLALDPTDGRAAFYAGEAYLALGERKRAASFYEDARRLAPGTEHDLRAAARLAELQGGAPASAGAGVQQDLRTGADLFDRALRTTQEIPTLADRYFAALTVARLQAMAGWHAAAQDTFGQVIAAAPAFEDVDPAETVRRRVWAVAGAADIQCLAGYPEEARATRAKATQLTGGDPMLLAIVLGSQQRCGAVEDARQTAAAIEKRVPGSKAKAAERDEFRYNLAAELSDEGVFDVALTQARAISNVPWKAFALAGIALEMRRFGRFAEAAKIFDESAAVIPADSPQARPLKQQIDQSRDDPALLPEAVGNLLRQSRFAQARGDLAAATRAAAAAVDALEQAKRAAVTSPDRIALAAADLVQQYVELGRMADARDVAATIGDPGFSDLARGRIAAGVAKAGDPAAAEKTLSSLKGDGRIAALIGIAIGHAEAGNADQARGAAAEAVSLIDGIESLETRAGLYAEAAVAYFALAPRQ